MTIVVLFSTLSFTIDMHYCGDTLVDSSILQKAKTCGMDMQNSSTNDCSIDKKDCCNDVQISIKGQEELKVSFEKLSINHLIFVVSFIYPYTNLFNGIDDNNKSRFRDYSPPLVISQIFKLDETYLI